MRRVFSFKTGSGFILAACFAFASFFPACASGADKQEKSKSSMSDKITSSNSPINITADRMEALQDKREIIFEGHVVVTQDDVTLKGNRMKVVGLPGEKGKESEISDKIDYIEVEGDVKVTQRERTATAEKGIFYQKDQKIVLKGSPVVTRGNDRISGNVITVYLQQGKSVVEGGRDIPVKAVLTPGKKD